MKTHTHTHLRFEQYTHTLLSVSPILSKFVSILTPPMVHYIHYIYPLKPINLRSLALLQLVDLPPRIPRTTREAICSTIMFFTLGLELATAPINSPMSSSIPILEISGILGNIRNSEARKKMFVKRDNKMLVPPSVLSLLSLLSTY